MYPPAFKTSAPDRRYSSRFDVCRRNYSGRIFFAIENKLVLGEVPVPVVSAEHLIAMKPFSAHNNPDRLFKDLGDVRDVITRSGISPSVVKKYFVKYEMENFFDDLTRDTKQ